MTNEEIIEEVLLEAENLRIREEVLTTMAKLLELNPKMERFDAVKLAMANAKLHADIDKNS